MCIRDSICTQDLKDEDYINNHYVIMATKRGQVKKTSLEKYSRPRANGINAITIKEEDELLEAKLTNGNSQILLAVKSGKAIRFEESKNRPMGRGASGVRGITLANARDEVVGMVSVNDMDTNILVVSENGYGKRTSMDEFPVKGRGNRGVIGMQTSDRNGQLVGAIQVVPGEQMMLISDQGTLVRCRTDEISELGRNTQGVRVIRLKEGELLVNVARIDEPEDDLDGENGAVDGVDSKDASVSQDTDANQTD